MLCAAFGRNNKYNDDNNIFSLDCGDMYSASRMVSVLDAGAEGPGFKSQPRRCRVTVLGKLFTHIVPSRKLVAALLKVARVTAGLAEGNGSLPPGL